MRISQLSAQTGVPVATIKFYLREKLLHDGVRTSPTQAQYDESHVARIRLIRALMGPGGLSVAAAYRVIKAIDEPPESVHQLIGVAANAVPGPSLEAALLALDEAGFELPEGTLDVYGGTCGRSRSSRSIICRLIRPPRPYGTWCSARYCSNQ